MMEDEWATRARQPLKQLHAWAAPHPAQTPLVFPPSAAAQLPPHAQTPATAPPFDGRADAGFAPVPELFLPPRQLKNAEVQTEPMELPPAEPAAPPEPARQESETAADAEKERAEREREAKEAAGAAEREREDEAKRALEESDKTPRLPEGEDEKAKAPEPVPKPEPEPEPEPAPAPANADEKKPEEKKAEEKPATPRDESPKYAPFEPWVRGDPSTWPPLSKHAPQTAEAFDLYVDRALNLPENCTVSRVSLKVVRHARLDLWKGRLPVVSTHLNLLIPTPTRPVVKVRYARLDQPVSVRIPTHSPTHSPLAPRPSPLAPRSSPQFVRLGVTADESDAAEMASCHAVFDSFATAPIYCLKVVLLPLAHIWSYLALIEPLPRPCLTPI